MAYLAHELAEEALLRARAARRSGLQRRGAEVEKPGQQPPARAVGAALAAHAAAIGRVLVPLRATPRTYN